MSKLISLSIDLTKIDKAQIKPHANGAKYYEFTISVNDEPNQHGQDVAAWNKQTKEEQAAKTPKVYLGNGKTFWTNEAKAVAATPIQQGNAPSNESDNLPF